MTLKLINVAFTTLILTISGSVSADEIFAPLQEVKSSWTCPTSEVRYKSNCFARPQRILEISSSRNEARKRRRRSPEAYFKNIMMKPDMNNMVNETVIAVG